MKYEVEKDHRILSNLLVCVSLGSAHIAAA